MNEGYKQSYGVVDPQSEAVHLFGGDVDVDRSIVDLQGYCCTFGDQGVTGLQGPFQGRYGISVRDLGEAPDAPVFRTRIDWYVGFGVMHPRSAGRLHGIAPLT